MRDKREKVPNKIDEKPANSMEKNYASKLGIILPENATQSDAKAIIARYLDNDEQASSSLLSYARRKGMLCSEYIGRKALHNQLFDHLPNKDKISFFCFCIYKFYWNESNEDMENHSKRELFEAFGEQFENDSYFKASMEEYLGEELVAFGKSKRMVNGIEKTIYGGSAHTRAHNEAYRYLKDNES